MEFNTLTTTLTNFIGVFQGGYTRLQPMINGLLAVLAGIDIVLIGFWWALGGGERLAEVMKKVLFLGFWLWFTKSFQSNAKAFVDSLINAGLTAGGQGGGPDLLLDPSAIASYGLTTTDLLVKYIQSFGLGHMGDAFVFGLCYFVIMASFLIMAIQVFLAVLEYYLMTAVAGVLVPWGLLPHTKFLAEKAIGAVVSSGIKLMVLAFIIAVTKPVISSMHFSSEDIKFNELWSMVLTSGAIAFLSWHAPSVAAGLLAGSPSLGAGAVAQNVSSGVMMSAALAGGMVAATRAATGGAASLGSHAGSGLGGGAGRSSGGSAISGSAGQLSSVVSAGKSAASAAARPVLETAKAASPGAAAIPAAPAWAAQAKDALQSPPSARPA